MRDTVAISPSTTNLQPPTYALCVEGFATFTGYFDDIMFRAEEQGGPLAEPSPPTC